MGDQNREMQNPRKPRTCKKTKQPFNESTAMLPPKRGRKTNVSCSCPTVAQSEAYGPGTSTNPRNTSKTPAPNVTVTNSAPEKGRSTRVRTNSEMIQSASRSRDLGQEPNAQDIEEQSVGYRQTTKRAAHNLPIPAAPTMNRYWKTNTKRPPVKQFDPPTQQKSTPPTPAAQALPPSTQDKCVQTQFGFTEKQIKVMYRLLEQKVFVPKIVEIIEARDYITTYDTKTAEKQEEKTLPTTTYNEIVSTSDVCKNIILAKYIEMQQALATVSLQAIEPPSAVEEPPQPPPPTNKKATNRVSPPLLRSARFKRGKPTKQTKQTSQKSREKEAAPANATKATPIHQQVPQQQTRPPVFHQGFPIPNIARFRNWFNPGQQRFPRPGPYNFGPRWNQMNFYDHHFLQAAALYMNPRFRNFPPQHPYGMFHNRNNNFPKGPK